MLLLTYLFRYSEGIDILYGTNTIHMASTSMILNLPDLLPPKRLASITSVEMIWRLHPFRPEEPQDAPDSGLDAFTQLLDIVPSLFPRLKTLYISLQGDMRLFKTGEEAFTMIEQVLLSPVDDMVSKLGPHVRECDIAVTSIIYTPRHKQAVSAGHKIDISGPRRFARHWRPLSNSGNSGRLASHRQGYWLRLGVREWPFSASSFSDGSQDESPSPI
jgi:hypothetical protein